MNTFLILIRTNVFVSGRIISASTLSLQGDCFHWTECALHVHT